MNNLTKDDESRVIATVIAAHDDTELHCNNPKEWEKRMQAALEVCFGPFLTQPSWKSLGEAERENYAQYIVRSTLPEEALTMAPVATLYAEAVRVGMNHWLPCHRREAMRKASAHLAAHPRCPLRGAIRSRFLRRPTSWRCVRKPVV